MILYLKSSRMEYSGYDSMRETCCYLTDETRFSDLTSGQFICRQYCELEISVLKPIVLPFYCESNQTLKIGKDASQVVNVNYAI